MPAKHSTTFYLTVLVFSQFAGTSLWFAGNAIVDQISATTNHAGITSFVQFGFISGTLVFSLLTIVDRFSARNVFFYSSLLAAIANLLIIWFSKNNFQLSLLRFITGFFLAGIYPVGMKIAADLFPEKLGKALGFLVGALVLGTSFPHFVRSQLKSIHWQTVIYTTSVLALIGGLLIWSFVPKKEKSSVIQKPDVSAAFKVFRSKSFRAAAFGYFGHMWEVYALWSILPVIFSYYYHTNQIDGNVYLLSFCVIATGSLGCAFGGMISQKWGSKNVAFYALLLSGICCVVAPFFFTLNVVLFYSVFIVWGISVAADSPQFSALVAKNAEEKIKGTALTIVTSIGFAITIVSIQLLKDFFQTYKAYGLWLLAIGPLFGLLALKSSK